MILNWKKISGFAFTLAASVAFASGPTATTPGPGTRFATDAYPGFDSEDNIVEAGRKTPRLFGRGGPEKDNAADQFAWAVACVSNQNWSAARKGFDALVRTWPTADEAPRAQKALADILYTHDLEYENAFREYKYLADYYSTQCDFDATVSNMYAMAKLMRQAGKDFMFFHFDNTVDVRRAFEAVVLRAPGAAYAPEAMMTIGQLREDEEAYEQAQQVYETVRNLYPLTPEAKDSVYREAKVRMQILKDHPYNRTRCLDTISFLKLALTTGADVSTRPDLERWRDEAVALLEDEAFKAAKFYDSRTRTKESAIAAYEKFLKEYPVSVHAEAANARLKELRQEAK